MFGARRAHSSSECSSANLTTSSSCSELSAPAAATAEIAGSASNARAVSTFCRTVRADSPSRPRDVSTRPRSSSTKRIECSSDCNRRISATTSHRRDCNHSVEWERITSRQSVAWDTL